VQCALCVWILAGVKVAFKALSHCVLDKKINTEYGSQKLIIINNNYKKSFMNLFSPEMQKNN